jgi:hypothetical protein
MRPEKFTWSGLDGIDSIDRARGVELSRIASSARSIRSISSLMPSHFRTWQARRNYSTVADPVAGVCLSLPKERGGTARDQSKNQRIGPISLILRPTCYNKNSNTGRHSRSGTVCLCLQPIGVAKAERHYCYRVCSELPECPHTFGSYSR